MKNLSQQTKAHQRDVITVILAGAHGNVAKAARILGYTRPGLHNLIVRLGINPNDYRPKEGP